MSFAPDQSVSHPDPIKTLLLPMPRNRIWVFRSSFHAHFENAIQVHLTGGPYMDDPHFEFEHGNYSRTSGVHVDSIFHPAGGQAGFSILWITGWHKDSPPDHTKPWHQSAMRFHPIGPESWQAWFEDGADNNFLDATMQISLGKHR